MTTQSYQEVFEAQDPFQAELRMGVKALSDRELSVLEDDITLYVDQGILTRSVSLFLQLSGLDESFAQAA